MRRLTGIRLQALRLPRELIVASPRPAFGIAGSRAISGVQGRPLIGSIVKPNIGYSPEQSAQVARELADGGIDFIKDDELIADAPYSPLAERAGAVMRVLEEAAQRHGRKAMYAFNITDGLDEMLRHHDAVLRAGGTCVMVNLNSVGLSALIALRRHSALPIHGHRAGWAMFTRCAALGMDFQPYQLLHRLAGVDQMHVSGLGGKFWEDAESVQRSARACLEQMDTTAGVSDDRAMPVFSGGSSVLEAKPTYQCAGGTDLIYAAGGAVFGHPGGIAAGVTSLRDAWDAAIQEADLARHAETRPHLKAAIAQRERQLAERRAQAQPTASSLIETP
jgi:ribulose-bisphosphate carboxylase large chain